MNKLFMITAAVVIIVLMIVGVERAKRLRQDEQHVVTIGVVLPLTGRAADQGKDILSGIELARDEINSKRTPGQPRLDLAVEDDMGDPKSGVAALEKLILTIASSVMLAMIPIAEREKVVLLSPAASSSKISNSGKYIFRLSLLAPPQAEALAGYACNRMRVARGAILYSNDETGISYRDAFRDAFVAKGGEIVFEQPFERTDTDFRIQLTRLKAVNAEVCFVPSIPQTIGLILKQAKELGIKIQFVGNYGAEGESLLTTAGEAAEGFIYASIPISRKFESAYRQKTGRAPTIGAPLGYDALHVVWESVAGSPSTEGVRERLAVLTRFQGATGMTSMTPSGDADKEVVIKTVFNGVFLEVR